MSAVVVAAGAFLISRPGPQVADLPEPTVPVVTDDTRLEDITTTSLAPTTTEVPETVPTTAADASVTPAPDTTPPAIDIVEPLDGSHFTESRIRFAGTTEPGATVAVGPFDADVDAEGNWSIVLVLSEGGNRATVVATDEAGNSAEASTLVYLDPPVTTTIPKEEPPPDDPPGEEISFAAEQLYGTCAEDPPFDVFFGTGVPGHIVKVTSDYGSGDTTIKEDGTFEIEVFFPTAPLGETFTVTVKDKATGESFVFEFVHTG